MVVDSIRQLDVSTWGVMLQPIQRVLTLMNCHTLNWEPYVNLMGTVKEFNIFLKNLVKV